MEARCERVCHHILFNVGSVLLLVEELVFVGQPQEWAEQLVVSLLVARLALECVKGEHLLGPHDLLLAAESL